MARHHIKTPYLDVDKAKCTACGTCVEECTQQVLEIVGIEFLIIKHRHVNVVRPDDCIGCLSCVEVCPENAILENA